MAQQKPGSVSPVAVRGARRQAETRRQNPPGGEAGGQYRQSNAPGEAGAHSPPRTWEPPALLRGEWTTQGFPSTDRHSLKNVLYESPPPVTR